MPKKILKFKTGDTVPDGARFLRAEKVQVGRERRLIGCEMGLLWTTHHYKFVEIFENVFWYEVEVRFVP